MLFKAVPDNRSFKTHKFSETYSDVTFACGDRNYFQDHKVRNREQEEEEEGRNQVKTGSMKNLEMSGNNCPENDIELKRCQSRLILFLKSKMSQQS